MKAEELIMLDAIAGENRQLITISATQTELIAVVAHLADLLPDLTPAELSEALQVATTEAERRALRSH